MKSHFQIPGLFLLQILLFPGILSAQVNTTTSVSFILQTPGLPDTVGIYITGSHGNLGMWDPGEIQMHLSGKETRVITVQLPVPGMYEYKFTRGTWQQEGAGADGFPLKNRSVSISRDTTIRDTILNWTRGAAARVNHGQVTGQVRYFHAPPGTGVKDRDLVVWLPPGFDPSGRVRYPVLYMHDGQNLFDPVTSFAGTDWGIDEAADSLIREGTIPPLIIVGINNTPDRMTEYLPGEKGTAYMDFVVGKVKPFIDSVFPTRRGRESTYTGGSSAGGAISFMLIWEHPDVFSAAICMSPAFIEPETGSPRWNCMEMVMTTRKIRKDMYFYIDNGGVGLDLMLKPGTDEMVAALEKKGFRPGRNFKYITDPSAEHNEAAWSKRIPRALMLVCDPRKRK